jgi:Phage tail tube protein
MPQRSRLTMVAAKLESSYGIDAQPTVSADGQLMYAKFNPVAISPKVFNVQALRASFSPLPRVVTPAAQKWDGESLLQGSGAAGTPPRLDALLQGCQMAAAVTAGASVTYTPSSAAPLAGSPQSTTIYTYLDGNLHKVAGAVGSLKLSGKAGEPIRADFSMQGLYASPQASPNPGGFTTDSFLATFMQNAALKLKSSLNPTYYYPTFVAFDFDEGLKIAERADASSAFAVNGFMPVSREAKLTLTLEADFANRNFFPELEQGALLEAYFFQGSAPGNTVLLGFPSAQLVNLKYGDAGGIRTIELSLSLVTTAATQDSEFYLSFS